MKNKLPELSQLLQSGNFDIICITETWFDASLPDSLIVDGSCYNVFRCDRETRSGGGVCICVKSWLNCKLIDIQQVIAERNIDILCLDLLCTVTNYRIFAWYIPPKQSSYSTTADFAQIFNQIESFMYCDASIVFIGDFNFPELSWSRDLLPEHYSGQFQSIFANFVRRHALMQFVTQPTRCGNFLDLVFCNDSYAIYNVRVEQPFSTSDHNAITFKILAGPSDPTTSDRLPAKFNFKKANWAQLLRAASDLDWPRLLSNKPVAALWDIFHHELTTIISAHVPRANISRPNRRKYKITYPKHIKYMQIRKAATWSKWQTTKDPAFRASHASLAKECRKAIHKHIQLKEQSLIQANNLGQFYKYVNRKLATKTGVGILKTSDGENVCEPPRQAVLLNDYFASTFVEDDGLLPEFPARVADNQILSTIPFSAIAILTKLKNLRESGAGGPDGLPPCVLKKLAPSIALPLSIMFEEFFINGYVPPAWKIAYVRPILKGGCASSTSNYRPISLTSTCSKIMEAIISDHMSKFLLQNGLISDEQHGFLARRSTCTQLLESFHDWTLSLRDNNPIDVVYLDFSKAFDSLTHPKLLHKLSSYGIRYELLTWIKAFLEDRSQSVLIDRNLSDSKPVISGVIQGSVLGPLLFILFVNDIVDLLEAPAACKLYADDVKLYSQIEVSNVNSIASTLSKIEEWSRKWQLRLNPSKCSVLHIGRNNPETSYSIGNCILPAASSTKDLGLLYDSSLKFDEYIHSITTKAYQRIGLIFRGFTSRNADLLTKAFTTYVRPIVEYCTSVWNPHLLQDIDALESVQRYFTRRLFPRSLYSYKERLFLLNLESLELRRLKSDLTMYFKIINQLVINNPSKFFSFCPSINHTRGHNRKLQKQSLPNSSLANTFSNRAIDCWNSLPSQVVTATTLRSFTCRLAQVDLSSYLRGRTLEP